MTCVHFWVLNSHNLGVCKKCHGVKQFGTEIDIVSKANAFSAKAKRLNK